MLVVQSQSDILLLSATRAYKQALATLSTLTANPPSYTRDPSFGVSNAYLSSYLEHSPGPLASAIRIVLRLKKQPGQWLRQVLPSLGVKDDGSSGKSRKEDEARGKAVKVLDLLQHSAELGHTDALYTLGQISLLPPNSYFPVDPSLAFNAFSQHVELTGNATSQGLLGFFYSTGYRDVVPVDQAKAQLYYTFAAHGGDKAAQMALGYRFWAGIGTLQEARRAMDWYEAAAEAAMAKFLSGPPGGRTLPLTSARLSDLEGGVYGPGASVASTGINAQRPAIRAANARSAGETWEDILEYYLYNADRGETGFAYRLGKIFYQGSLYGTPGGIASGSEGVGAIPRDFQRARYYFLRIARQIWPRDPPNPLQPQSHKADNENGPLGYAASSAGYIGRMYLRGEGVKADMAMARLWFERGAEYGDRECHNGLGIIWRDGLVEGRKDLKKAFAHFGVAAGQDLAEAQVNLGKYHRSRGEMKIAMSFFEAAVRNGSPFEAFYYLAEMYAAQARAPATSSNILAASSATAVSFYKLVAERGCWGDDLLREADLAWARGSDRDKEMAMLRWWMAAERGSEIAQNNLAYVLDQDKSVLRLTRFAPITPSNDTARLALTQWTRSAAQLNVDALVKVGDYYYHGLGVPDEPEHIRYEKAAGYYRSAADTQVSALAMWNLGWMYENGLGVPMDFHLAKRYYDLALITNSEAYLPITLSLVKLYARSFWHTLRGGKGGLSLWSADNEGTPIYSRSLKGCADAGSRRGLLRICQHSRLGRSS
ncbi:HCP-like protein [Punctularia strigosozonata HHB-11173 SS5]|uniref:HCP-like protein n=1 Tax=Punctularia strigosozonata (strain HHB-11173) TaxID=741275 RepID=UPI0004416357|nr:HCP-like protein [Punctularia strigosozonata HHB-11173 SS5]EIN06738.1 HCP-like protein [Punctularia strigosozonata HHB-11173 SS5]